MKRFFLFGIVCTCVGLLNCANIPAAFAQTPEVDPPVAAAPAKVSPEKDKLIRELMLMTGVDKLSEQIMAQMMSQFQEAMPEIPKLVWERINTKYKQRYKVLIESIFPIYDKYYSEEDLQGLIAFYKTPLGQKVIAKTPNVTRESMTLANEWGMQIGQEVAEELESEAEKIEKAKVKKPKKNSPKGSAKSSGKPATKSQGI